MVLQRCNSLTTPSHHQNIYKLKHQVYKEVNDIRFNISVTDREGSQANNEFLFLFG